jgi:uncharacterized protein (TIGR02996 family)
VPVGRRGFLHRLPFGPQYEITGPTRIGRSRDCELVLDHDSTARVHCRVTVDDAGYWLEDLNSAGGTWIRRAGFSRKTVGRVLLEDGDELTIPRGARFVLESLPRDPVLEELAAAVAARPDDDGCWLVYGDRLLERGDPMGTRLARRTVGWDWLDDAGGPLVQTLRQLDWRFGHIQRAWFDTSPLADYLRSFVHDLEHFLAAPMTRFLVELGIAGPTPVELADVLARTYLPALRDLHLEVPLPVALPSSPYLRR